MEGMGNPSPLPSFVDGNLIDIATCRDLPLLSRAGRTLFVFGMLLGWLVVAGCHGSSDEQSQELADQSQGSVDRSVADNLTDEGPAISLPADLERVEPVIRRLIDKQVATIEASAPSDLAMEHAELGLIYEANGLWPEAREAFATAVDIDPSHASLRLHWAIALYETDDLQQSLDVLQALVEDAPDLAPAYQRIGHIRLAMGQLPEAESAFRRTNQLAPSTAEPLAGIAACMLQQDKVNEAMKVLNTAIKKDPSYRVSYYLMGTALRRADRLSEAVRFLQRGQGAQERFLRDELEERSEQYAVTLRVRHRRALQQMRDREFQAAAENLEAALVEDPDNLAMLNLLAGAYLQSGRAERSFEVLQQAKRLDEQNSTTFVNLASWYLNDGQLPDALENAEAAIERANWVLTAHYVRIETLIRMNRMLEARKALVQALRLAPADPMLVRYAKTVKERLGQP